VARAPIKVIVDTGSSSSAGQPSPVEIDALAGENLRRLLLRKGIKIYNPKTKRFDMPFATGDCAGEGLCGTCLVAIQEGRDLLSPPQADEKRIIAGRPLSWRASCRTVVGPNNQPGTIRLQTQPQSNFEDELDPGVREL
jgi:ferredoxin